MHWECSRGCGMTGSKTYPSAGDARRYAAALDHDERADIGKRAPLSLVVLRLARRRRTE